jgi:hypothetical protein
MLPDKDVKIHLYLFKTIVSKRFNMAADLIERIGVIYTYYFLSLSFPNYCGLEKGSSLQRERVEILNLFVS